MEIGKLAWQERRTKNSEKTHRAGAQVRYACLQGSFLQGGKERAGQGPQRSDRQGKSNSCYDAIQVTTERKIS